MTTFQQSALILIIIWLVLVVFRFPRSGTILIGELLLLGLYTIVSVLYGKVTLQELGLSAARSWVSTIGFAVVGLVAILGYSPIADRLAVRWFEKPPTLEAFAAIQQSISKLIAGIVVTWLLGGILEELIARGIVLRSVEVLLSPRLTKPLATGIAVCVTAIGAGLLHSYQGRRAMAIITQISFLFGLLFVVNGYTLWAVILCHGLYDTTAFIRFASGKSRYSKLDDDEPNHPT